MNPYESDESNSETFFFTSCFRVDGLNMRKVGFNVEKLNLNRKMRSRESVKSDSQSGARSTNLSETGHKNKG